MEGGRMEIINWLNDTLQLSYTKIEQTASGAAHCQIMDILFPGKINLSKVNFNAKYDYEYIKNFNYLQEIFLKVAKIEKYHMDVDKMVTGRPQANLEFCQWMKKYYDSMYSGEPYNALERRVQSKCNYDGDKPLLAALGPNAPKPSAPKTAASSKPSATTASKPSATTTTKPATTTTVKKPAATTTTTKPASTATRPSTATATKPTASTVTRPSITPSAASTSKPISQPVFKPSSSRPSTATRPSSVSPVPAAVQQVAEPVTTTKVIEQLKTVTIIDPELVKELEQAKEENEKMLEENTKLKLQIEEVERDRDFFYEKLRDVEIFCQDNAKFEGSAEEAIDLILKILYKNAEGDVGEEQENLDGGQQNGEGEQVEEEEVAQEEEELIQEEDEQIIEDDEERIMNQLASEDEIIDDLEIDNEVLESQEELMEF